MRKHLILFAILAAAALAFVPLRPAQAQQLYGAIRGVVTDQSGAVIPEATVTAINTSTGISRTTTTEANGSFELLNMLAPAVYNVSIEKSGFQKYSSTSVSLNVNQVYVVNATLRVGLTTQQVMVEARPAQIDTTTMQRGTTISGQQIENLPLNGRNWTQLQQLEPGVVSTSDRFGTFSTNGAETQQNSYLINGADSMDLPLNTPGIIPSPDALSEFRMVTSTINPEFSRNSGAVMNVLIKNGTNAFHGDAFEFYRDKTLDARSFFQSTVSPFHRNEFGGTLGGPIYKNHAFFFLSYQGFREAEPEGGFSVPTVFSQNQRNGDWPGLATSKGTSAFPLVGDNGTTYPAGTPYSTIFSNNTIPTADMNPLAVKLMGQFVPLPNAPANTYTFNPTTTEIQDQGVWRVDENIRARDAVWATGFWEREPSVDTLPFTGATLPGFASTDQRHFQIYSGDWTHIFGPTATNEARLSYFRFNFIAVDPVNAIDPTAYGFTGILPQNKTFASLPIVSLTGFFTLGFSANGPQPRIDQTYDVADNFSKIWGSHTFKAGFTMERFQVFNPFFNNLGGNFSFGGAGQFSTSLPGADFLLGIPDSYAQGSGAIIDARAREYYSYAQDQWHAKRNLTLTYGLGWDIETPYLNRFAGGEIGTAFRLGQSSTIFPPVPTGSENPTTGAPVGFVYPGDPGINKYGGPTVPYKDFAPRFGFAWTPRGNDNWSVRGGFGIYYNRTEEELALQGLTNAPFSTSSPGVRSVGGSPAFATPFSGWCSSGGAAVPCSTPNVFPFSPPAKGAAVSFAPFYPLGFSMGNILSPHFGVPMSENYNLTVEHQLTPTTLISVAYVGNVAHHLEGAYDLNPAGEAPGINPGAAALGCNAFNLATCDPGSFPLNASVYGGPGLQVTDFNSNYNSLQVEVNKHFSNGLQFLVSYTWSRYFDYTSNLENSAFNAPGVNPFDLNSNYAPSANDAPQRLVVSYMYTLPIYHFVHRFRRLTDGWNLLGIATFQHGFPVSMFDSAFTSLTCDPAVVFYACPDRANVVPGTPLVISNPRTYTIGGSPNYWFNPGAFSIPNPGTGVGNASRNPLYGPGINNWDIALLKDIHITESKYIQLRLETFDTFNIAQFAAPVGDVNNPLNGRIFGVQDGSTNGAGRVLQLGGKFYF